MKTIGVILGILLAAVATAGDIENHETLIEYHCLYDQISAYHWFGLRHDGHNMGCGMRIELAYRTIVGSVEFYFHNAGYNNNGIRPMVAGDPIHTVVMTPDEVVVAEATSPMPLDVGYAWVEFAFDEPGVDLPPGVYLIAAYTDVPRQCGMACCNDQGFAAGARVSSANGLAGPWTALETMESAFRLHLEQPTVAANEPSWTSLRSRFR